MWPLGDIGDSTLVRLASLFDVSTLGGGGGDVVRGEGLNHRVRYVEMKQGEV